MTDHKRHTAAALNASPASPPPAPPGEAETRTVVTIILALIAALTFTFSFGNIWALGLQLGVSPWIAPLVGPAVDLSVVGLLIAIRHLSIHGATGRQLRPARCLLAATGLATLTLNIAEPILQGAHGRAAFDTVGPGLLIGWAEVGPGLLRQLHPVRPPRSQPGHSTEQPKSTTNHQPGPPPQTRTAQPSRAKPSPPTPAKQTDLPRSRAAQTSTTLKRDPGRTQLDLLAKARKIDTQHRAQHGRPVSADTLRHNLRIGSSSARNLVTTLRADNPTHRAEDKKSAS